MLPTADTEWTRLASEIEDEVSENVLQFERLPEELIIRRPGVGEWSAKEVIGHLIDSASNNHQRFVRLQISAELLFPGYGKANSEWIKIQKYQQASWKELLRLWKALNFHLAHVIRNVDPRCLKNVWEDESGNTVTLAELMTDYLRHLREHVGQVRASVHP